MYPLLQIFIFAFYLLAAALGNVNEATLRGVVESTDKRRSSVAKFDYSLPADPAKDEVLLDNMNGYQVVADDSLSSVLDMQREGRVLDRVSTSDGPASMQASLGPGKRELVGELMKLVSNDLEMTRSKFGVSFSLSTDGSTALIGAHLKDEGNISEAGAAFAYSRSDQQWSVQQKLVANDLEADAHFGRSVALSADGSTALIGAYFKDEGGLSRAGAAYAFSLSGQQWSQGQKLVAYDLEADAGFGISVALSADGSTALIGAHLKDEGGLDDAGAAYVFARSDQQWIQGQKLVANDIEAFDQFAFSVAISADGSTALIGALYKDEGGLSRAGAAYAFSLSGQQWSQGQKLVANDFEAVAFFGVSVAISADGSAALIAAHLKDEGGLDNTGAAYAFTLSGQQWSQGQKLVANDLEADARFGRSVALSADGSTALIGAHYKVEGGLSRAGAAYSFSLSGQQWSQGQKLVANDLEADALFGHSIAISADGSTALIGAHLKDEGGLDDAGAAYIGSFSTAVSPGAPSPSSNIPLSSSFPLDDVNQLSTSSLYSQGEYRSPSLTGEVFLDSPVSTGSSSSGDFTLVAVIVPITISLLIVLIASAWVIWRRKTSSKAPTLSSLVAGPRRATSRRQTRANTQRGSSSRGLSRRPTLTDLSNSHRSRSHSRSESTKTLGTLEVSRAEERLSASRVASRSAAHHTIGTMEVLHSKKSSMEELVHPESNVSRPAGPTSSRDHGYAEVTLCHPLAQKKQHDYIPLDLKSTASTIASFAQPSTSSSSAPVASVNDHGYGRSPGNVGVYESVSVSQYHQGLTGINPSSYGRSPGQVGVYDSPAQTFHED